MKLSISKTMVTGLVLLQLLTVVVILSTSYSSTEKVLVQHVNSLMHNLSREVIARSEEFLLPASKAAELTASLLNNQVLSQDQPEAMERYLFEQLVGNANISGLYYGDLQGNFYFARRSNDIASIQIKRITEENGQRTVTNHWFDEKHNLLNQNTDPADAYDPKTRPWFTKAFAEQASVWTEPYNFFTSQKPGITFATPVFSPSGELQGVVGVDIYLTSLSLFLDQLNLSDGASAMILNNSADVIAHRHIPFIDMSQSSQYSRQLPSLNAIERPVSVAAVDALGLRSGWLLLNTAEVKQFEFGGKKYHAVFSPFSQNWPWLLGIYIPEEDFLSQINMRQNDNLITAVVITAISLLLCVLFARALTKPIQAIQRGINAVEKGLYEVNLDAPKSFFYDIEETNVAFKNMLLTLKSNRQQKKKLQMALKTQTNVTEVALDCLDDGILISDMNGIVAYRNNKAAQIRGLEVGKSFMCGDTSELKLFDANENALIHQDDWPLCCVLKGRSVEGAEFIIVGIDGEKHRVRVHGALIRDQEAETLGAILRIKHLSYT